MSRARGAAASTPPPAKPSRLLPLISRTAALFAALVAVAVLVAWAVDIEWLRSVIPGEPVMVPNTATGIGLLGISLWCLAPPLPKQRWRIVGLVCAGASALIGALVLVEYLFRVNLHIDLLLFHNAVGTNPLLPGRPAPTSALSLALLASALLVIDRRSRRRIPPTEILAFVAGTLALTALSGYAFGAQPFYGIPGVLPATAMAIHTALCLFGLAVGTLCARPSVGVMAIISSPLGGGYMARRLLLAVLAIPPIGLVVVGGSRLRLYGQPLASGLIAVVGMLFAMVLIVLTARSLNRADAERRQLGELLEHAYQTEQALRRELQAVTTASQAVSEAVASVPHTNLNAVLHTLALQAQALTGAELVALGIGTDVERPFDPWVSIGVPAELIHAMGHTPRPIGTLGAVARKDQPLRTPDVTKHPAFQGLPPNHPPITSFLGVPIHYLGHSVGNVYLANKKGGVEFTEQDQRLIEMLAARAASSIETARLFENEAVARAWLSTVIDQMPEGVLLLDECGSITAQNRSLSALLCAPDGEADPFGNPLLLDLRLPDGKRVPPSETPHVRALLHEETTSGRELLVRLESGQLLPVSVSAAPVYGPELALTGATLLVRDISPAKQLERLREEWASVVAHDLRQPVAAISLVAQQLARRPGASESESRLFGRIRSATDRLTRMISDLMDVSRIESRRMVVDRAPVDLLSLVNEVVERMLEVTTTHEVHVEPHGTNVPVWCDAGRIEQVITNLLSNAAKYGDPAEEITVDVDWQSDRVVVTVSNHGPGLAPTEVELLFERFVRADRTQGIEGLGLGLYICKGLIEAHGGRIWVESTPGEVTRFHFTLPLQRAESDVRADAHPQS